LAIPVKQFKFFLKRLLKIRISGLFGGRKKLKSNQLNPYGKTLWNYGKKPEKINFLSGIL